MENKNHRWVFRILPPKNKKGSHLGIVFSLIIFVSFLVFLYIIAAPGLVFQKDKTLAMEQLKVKLPQSFSADLTEITVSSPDGEVGCFKITSTNFGTYYIVKNKAGEIVPSFLQGSTLEINTDLDEFYKVYSSEQNLGYTGSGLGTCSIIIGTIESSKTSKKVFETKIVEFIDIYGDDYEDLKESLNIAFETDFSFKFTDKDDVTVGPDITDKTLEVFVEEIPLEYVDAEANLNLGILTISVW